MRLPRPSLAIVGTLAATGLLTTAAVLGWSLTLPSMSALAHQAIGTCGVLASLVSGLTSAIQRHRLNNASEQLAESEHRAHHDRLTGLLNR